MSGEEPGAGGEPAGGGRPASGDEAAVGGPGTGEAAPGYGPSTFGDRIAAVYDAWYADLDPTAAVELLAELAGGGPVLELGIGTGRIAIPLRARGLDVRGIDASPAMVERLREKPGGADLPVTVGDFADMEVAGPFSVVFAAFNTFFGLLDQETQVRCFRNVAERLSPGGAFLMEAFVPDPCRFDRGQRLSTGRVDGDTVFLEAARHDPVRQRVTARQIVLGPGTVDIYPIEVRYAWPAELDLMAGLAGLRLRERWGGWRREPFTAESGSHVSVWERPEGP